MGQLPGPSDGAARERVGLCVIRFRTWDGRLVMTVTMWTDVESGAEPTSFSTVDVDDVLDAVRRKAREVSRGPDAAS